MAAKKAPPAPVAPTAPVAPIAPAAPVAKVKVEKVKVEKAPRDKLPEQNGVSHPKAGTTTCRVWDIADEVSKAMRRPAHRDEVLEKGALENPPLNTATMATQYQRWRVFHAVPKAEPKPKAVKVAPVVPVAPAAPAAPAAPKKGRK